MKAYKLLRLVKGKLYPLYVNASKETPIGVWLPAEEGPRTESGKVKSRLNELAFRPGWHCSADVPYETHIGIKDKTGRIVAMRKDMVWCECEVSDKVDYQNEANENGLHKNGKFVPRDADLDHIPVDGYYRYKTNPNMFGEWIIAGAIKLTRILSDTEVKEICNQYGLEPLPRATA